MSDDGEMGDPIFQFSKSAQTSCFLLRTANPPCPPPLERGETIPLLHGSPLKQDGFGLIKSVAGIIGHPLMTKRLVFSFLFFLAASTRAEFHFMVQGRLADSEGNPIGVQTAVEWRLYRDGNATDTSGTAVYRETGFITPVNALGVFSYELGSGTPVGGSLDLSVYTTTAPLYALLLVDGSELLPKLKVTPVPRSHVATLAETVATDSVDTPGLKNGSVTGLKIAAGAVSGSHIDTPPS